jgi:ABC-2 type transport system ATP-binding protein
VEEVLGRFGQLVPGVSAGVSVRLAPGDGDLATVVRALDAAGVKVDRLQLHEPTLDDVFLAKTGHSLEGAGEADAGSVEAAATSRRGRRRGR